MNIEIPVFQDNTLDPRFSGLDGPGTCPDYGKVQIAQLYLCNAIKTT